MRIEIFSTVLLLIIFLTASTSQAEEKPLRLAHLPIIFQSQQPSYEVCAELETKLVRALHVPLNGTLKVVEYLPPETTTAELSKIWAEMRGKDKRAKIKNALKPFAEKVDADVVVCPILRRYYQAVFPVTGMDTGTRLVSSVSAELIIYDARTGEITDKKVYGNFDSGYSKFGTAAYLANDCFNKLIEETNLRRIVREAR